MKGKERERDTERMSMFLCVLGLNVQTNDRAHLLLHYVSISA